MVEETRLKRRILHQSGDRIARSNAALRRISEPWCDVVLRYRVRRKRSAISSLPLRSGRKSNCRRRGGPARCARGPSTAANDNTRPRRRSGRTRSKTSSLSIKLCLQVPGNGTISTSTNVLYSVVLIISIRGTLGRVSYSLAFSKAIRQALAPTTTALTQHLQKKKKHNKAIQESEKSSISHSQKT